MKKYLFLLFITCYAAQFRAQSYVSVQTLTFDVMGPQNISFFTLQTGINYKLQMSGTWGDFSGVASYDTRYYMQNGQDFGYNYFIAAPAWLKNLSPNPSGYNLANHTYSLYFTGDGSTIAFTYTDSGYSDNTGVVTFELFQECASVNVSLGKDTAVCGTPAITLTASGGTTYTWYDAATGGSVISTNSHLNIPSILNTDTFFVSTTFSNGCESNRDTVIVTVNPVPVVSFSLTDQICLDDASVTLNGMPSGGSYSGTGINGSVFNPSVAGTGSTSITYSYTTGKGCSASKSGVITVEACSGLLNHEPPGLFTVFPNPVNDVLNVLNEKDDVLQIRIFSTQGKLFQDCVKCKTVLVSELPTGIYFIEIQTNNESTIRKRFVKE